MNAPLDGRERDTKKSCDALERHLVLKAQAKHERVIRRNIFEREPDLFVSSVLVKHRPGERAQLFEKQLVQLQAPIFVGALTFVETQSAMARDGRKPGGKLRRVFNRRQGFEGQQERVLRDIFGLVAPEDSLRRSDGRRAITQSQLIECVKVT